MLSVTLLSHTKTPEQTIAAAIRQCYSPLGGKALKEKTEPAKVKRLIRQIIDSGHHSTIEHASYTFAVEGVSRALTHQLVRHRVASFSHQSQRYVQLKDGKFDYILPPTIKANPALSKKFAQMIQIIGSFYKEMTDSKIPAEDARYILPNCAETKIIITMNARELLHFFRMRLCIRAQWEIRQLAQKMLNIVREVSPEIFKYAGPSCETEKICWEGNLSCGKWKTITGAILKTRGND